ncbi:MAG: hypothetical protein U0031_02395 [Thermomicrobiales bacterium]
MNVAADKALNWVLVALLAIGVNAVPAFMPPTWSILAYFHIQEGLPVLPLAALGAAGATTGRAFLALVSRAFGERVLPSRWRANIGALAEELERRSDLGLLALALFALGPIPSNQLFVAAGIARAPLPPILAVFCLARFISYLVWVTLAEQAAVTLTDLVRPRFGAGAAVLIQIVAFVALIAVMQVDWRRVLSNRSPNDGGNGQG